MNLPQTEAPPVPDVAKKDKPHLGRAIDNGVLRFLSVSQVTKFDPTMEGCPRRWAFQYKWGKKEERTKKQDDGTEYARQLEHYLKTGENVLVPILRAGQHLLPKPGVDLEVEKKFGDTLAAVKVREQYLIARQLGNRAEAARLAAEIKRIAGLSANCIPFDGAPDVRHYRGEYIDEDGVLRREDPGLVVAEIIDHKTTTRIFQHVTRGGKVLPGWAKSADEIVRTVQMGGYGELTANQRPDVTHTRLGHVYYQTANGYCAAKRSALVPVDVVRRRWERVETVAREMEDIAATASESRHVPYNTGACRAYNRDCPHMAYCDRPARSFSEIIADAFDKTPETFTGDNTMSLFDMVQGATPTNGVQAAQPSLFDMAAPAPSAPPVPVAPQMTEEQRQAQIEAEKQRLLQMDKKHPLEGLEGYTVGQHCNGLGYYRNQNNPHSFLPVESGHSCPACVGKAPGPVNPPDRPGVDPLAAAAPLTAEAIAQITNPELKAVAEAHAREHAARAAAEEAAKQASQPKKTSGKCGASGKTVPLTDKEKATRKTTCAECGKAINISDKWFTPDFTAMVMPGHMIPKVDGAASTARAAPVASAAPSVAPSVPAVPPAVAPSAPAVPPVAPSAVPAVLSGLSAAPVTPAVTAQVSAPSILEESMTIRDSQGNTVAVSAPVVAPVIPVAPAVAVGIVLFVDVAFDKGDSPASLEAWYLDIVRSIEQKYGLVDIRMAPNTSDLGDGRWKGYLAGTVRANLPKPGEYVIRGTAMNEVIQEIVAALVPYCDRVVRGGVR